MAPSRLCHEQGWAGHSSDLLCPFVPSLQLAAVHLVDSHYCTDPGKFISVLCTSLSTMLHVELPHVNVLSKMDLIEHYGKLGEDLLSHGLLWGLGAHTLSLLPPFHQPGWLRAPFWPRTGRNLRGRGVNWGARCK